MEGPGKSFGPRRCSRRWVLGGIGAAILLIATTSCSDPATRRPTPTTVPSLIADPVAGRWPPQILHADPDVQEAYRFAVDHPELRYIPCYCGCVNQNHASNWDCYIAEQTSDHLLLNAHALGCGICVSITSDVKTLEGQGVPLRDIRQRIDAKWELSGPGTKTPLPPT